jgi:hypothetical protein
MKKIIAAAFLLTSGLANATLVSSGDQVIDSVSGASWFKVTETTGITYNQMQTQFITPGSKFYGYHYGTTDQWAQLMLSGGYTQPFPFTGYSDASIPAVQNIMNLFGLTSNPSSFGSLRTDGMLNAEPNSVYMTLGFLQQETFGSSQSVIAQFVKDAAGITANDIEFDDDWHMPMGSWILKADAVADVPEPSSLALIALGLAGFAVGSKRSRK